VLNKVTLTYDIIYYKVRSFLIFAYTRVSQLDDEDIAKFWDENAENWTKLARMGYDRCRDLINSPLLFLPDMLGCTALPSGR